MIMELETIRRVFDDEWIKVPETKLQSVLRCPPSLLAWFLPPVKGEKFSFINYILGYRVLADDDEMALIRKHNMLLQPFIQLRRNDAPISFAEALGPEWVVDVQPNQTALLQVELQLTGACETWTKFFESVGQ